MRLSSSPSSSSAPKVSRFDRPIAIALSSLLVVYSCLTAATYHKISDMNTNVDVNSEPGRLDLAVPHTERVMVAAKATSVEALQKLFPIHVSPQTSEVIDHPALLAMTPAAQAKWPPNLPRNMTVPRFFDESHGSVYGGTIREYLGGGRRLMTLEEAQSIGSIIEGSDGSPVETIYCSVASYRDPECSGTVADVFERALHPERIRVAIIDQRTADDPICGMPEKSCEQDPNQTLCKYKHLIDRYEVDARFACGPVFARHLAHRHYRGEYFAMQIDAHVRFIEHWDADLVRFWKSANNEMAVLTTYLSDINDSIDPVTHESKHKSRPIMCQSDYEGNGEYKHLRHGQQPEGIAMITGQPTLEPFWAAGFSFARGHFTIQVPYDQYLPMVFQGEEISIGLRGFTYGYDYYTPEKGVCFHMYAIKTNASVRKKVPLFWENGKMYSGVGMRSMRRLNSLIGMDAFPREDWLTNEEESYGLGKIRDSQTFFDVFGIHSETHSVEHHLCKFVGKPMMKEFLPALREDKMGIDYSKISYRFHDPDVKKTKATQK